MYGICGTSLLCLHHSSLKPEVRLQRATRQGGPGGWGMYGICGTSLLCIHYSSLKPEVRLQVARQQGGQGGLGYVWYMQDITVHTPLTCIPQTRGKVTGSISKA